LRKRGRNSKDYEGKGRRRKVTVIPEVSPQAIQKRGISARDANDLRKTIEGEKKFREDSNNTF